MPDITLCMNENCPIRKRCGRFMGEPDNLWQSFANYQPNTQVSGEIECDYYWDIKEYPYKIKEQQ